MSQNLSSYRSLRNRISLRAMLGIYALAVVSFASSLGNGFAYDDLIHIQNNPSIRSLSQALGLFSKPTFPGDLYRPLSTFTYALNFAVSGLQPCLYHLVNVLLHGAVAVLVYILLLQLMRPRESQIGAVLFGIAPVHTEVVANVIGRAELLAAFFGIAYLLVSLSFLREKSGSRFQEASIASALLLLALLSKESAIVFPLLLVPLFVITSKPLTFSRTLLQHIVATVIAVAAFLLLRLNALGWVVQGATQTESLGNALITLPAHLRIIKAFALLGRYFVLCIIPYPLSADYSFAYLNPHWEGLEDLLYLIAAGSLFIVAFTFKRSKESFCAAWFFIAFTVTANVFFPIGTIFGERLVYLPSVGIYGLIGIIFARLSVELLYLFLGVVTALFSAECFLHAPVWRYNYSLHTYQIEVSPQSAKTQANYAVVLRNIGDLQQALQHIRNALAIEPNDEFNHYIAGTIYVAKGEYQSALDEWHRALLINPYHVDTLIGVGQLYFNRGEVDRAETQFENILRLEPEHFEANLGMAMVFLRQGKFLQAARAYNRLKLRRPEDSQVQELGTRLKAIHEMLKTQGSEKERLTKSSAAR